MVFWEGATEELEHFLRGISEFPSTLVIVPPRFRESKALAERLGRNILFMELEDAKLLFKPKFTFHYSKNGSAPEEVAVKVKQDFNVLLVFGRKEGEPISLKEWVGYSTAAPLMVYEILKLLNRF